MRLFVHDAAHDAAEAFDGGAAGFAVRLDDALALALEQAAFEFLALGGEGEQALAAVGAALCLGDVALLDEGAEHAGQALFGDAEHGEEFADRHASVAADEMQHPVMGAAEAEFFEDDIGGVGEIAVGEKQHVLGGADFRLAEEEEIGAGGGIGLGILHDHSGFRRRVAPRRSGRRHGWHAGKLRQEC